MGQVRNARHLDFNGNCDLALDLFRAAAGPLRDDLHVVVGHVGVSLDRQGFESHDAPSSNEQDSAKHQPSALEREVDEGANHYWFPAVSSSRALPTTCCPGSRCARITWRFPGSISPASTSWRLN